MRQTTTLEAVDELLRRAQRRLSEPSSWTRGHQATRRTGEATLPESAEAVCWDVLGALRVEAVVLYGCGFRGPALLLYEAAVWRLAEALFALWATDEEGLPRARVSTDGPSALAAWNDDANRISSEVVALLALAASNSPNRPEVQASSEKTT